MFHILLDTCSNPFAILLKNSVTTVILQNGSFFFSLNTAKWKAINQIHPQDFVLCFTIFPAMPLPEVRSEVKQTEPAIWKAQHYHVVQYVSVGMYVPQKEPPDTKGWEVPDKYVSLKFNNEIVGVCLDFFYYFFSFFFFFLHLDKA